MAIFAKKINTQKCLEKTLERSIKKSKTEDEWIWVEGYKGVLHDLKPSYGDDHKAFEVGTMYSVEGDVIQCRNGYHFSLTLSDAMHYYLPEAGKRYFKVMGLVRNSDYINYGKTEVYSCNSWGAYQIPSTNTIDKLVARSIVFLEEVDFEVYKDKIRNPYITNFETYLLSHDADKFREYIRGEICKELSPVGFSELFMNVLIDRMCKKFGEEKFVSKDHVFYKIKAATKEITALASTGISTNLLVYTIMFKIL